MMRFIKDRLISILFRVFWLLPIQKKKIIVSSFNGAGYGAEGKAIIDALIACDKSYDIVWVLKDMETKLPEGIRGVKFNSIKWIYEHATAKVWIDNRRKNIYFRKRKGQYYIQTWHGSVCIKAVEKDATDNLSFRYIKMAQNDSRMADLFVSGSEWRTKNYRAAFWYNGPILKGDLYDVIGRSKNLESEKDFVFRYFNIPHDAHLVLYAPTFRADKRLDCYDIDYNRLITDLENKYGGEWYAIIRLHPNMSELNNKLNYDGRIINGSLLPQVYGLISAADVVISDYSGVIFDGFRIGKRVILYASDFDKYLKEERNLYFDFRTLPSPIAYNNEELSKIIENFDDEKYESEKKKFVDYLGYYLENAPIIIANKIVEVTGGQTK